MFLFLKNVYHVYICIKLKRQKNNLLFHYFWHCKESENKKESSKSTFRALETMSFAMEGRDKREQWILFAWSR